MQLVLAFPPSLNHMYPTTKSGRRILSKDGRDYKRLTAIDIMVQKAGHSFGAKPVRVDIEMYPPDNVRRDVDNYTKIVFDTMTYAKVWNDDSQVMELRIRKMPPGKWSRMVVNIKEAKDAAAYIFADEMLIVRSAP